MFHKHSLRPDNSKQLKPQIVQTWPKSRSTNAKTEAQRATPDLAKEPVHADQAAPTVAPKKQEVMNNYQDKHPEKDRVNSLPENVRALSSVNFRMQGQGGG